MTRRVALRITLLVLAAVGVIVALTVYFSSEKIPPCLVSGAPKWRPPTDRDTHRFLLVVPDRALCFYAIDDEHKLVGAVKLDGTTSAPAPPPPSLDVAVSDPRAHVEYTTRPGEFGFRMASERGVRLLHFPGFAWNPRFGPDPPDHGLALVPGRRQLWVLDAPNSAAHVFDVFGAPQLSPRKIDDVRFSKPLSGDENPCAHPRCERLGSLLASSDGRYVYVGDSGDVIDVAKRETVTNLEALHQSRLLIEVAWVNGKPVFPR
jgi:hypothetical protein